MGGSRQNPNLKREVWRITRNQGNQNGSNSAMLEPPRCFNPDLGRQSSIGEQAAGQGFTLLQSGALELANNLLQQTGDIKILRALFNAIPTVRTL